METFWVLFFSWQTTDRFKPTIGLRAVGYVRRLTTAGVFLFSVQVELYRLQDADEEPEHSTEKLDRAEVLFRYGEHQCFELFDRVVRDLLLDNAAYVKLLDRLRELLADRVYDRVGEGLACGNKFPLFDLVGEPTDRGLEQAFDLA